MRKYFEIIVLLILLMPNIVYANIQCNDGTISPSCGDCHRGCCSHHGGCAADVGISSNNSLREETTSQISDDTGESDDYGDYEDDNNQNIITSDNTNNDNTKEDDSSVDGLLGLLGIGTVIGVVSGNKKKRRNLHSFF